MSDVPEGVRRLAEERAAHRRAGEFQQADRLREGIRAQGFDVTDHPDGSFEVTPLDADSRDAPRRVRPKDVASVLDAAPAVDLTVQWLSEDWPEDVLRGIASFRRFEGERSVQHVVVETRQEPPDAWPETVEVIRLSEDPGFGAARNAGLRRSAGSVVVVADGSVEAEGDPYAPLEEVLADPAVGIAGAFGLVTADLREFEEANGPEVDAVEGYLMAFRRDLLVRGISFDDRYRFYRTADIDLCFQAKALGLRVVRVAVPVRRHEHRRWAAMSPRDRERLSKRNHYRFLDRFRGRTDLLVASG